MVAEKDGLDCAHVGRGLAQQAVADQRNRLDVAMQPAVVNGGDSRRTAFYQLSRRIDERTGHDEHRGRGVFRECVVAFGNAARHLEIYALVLEGLLCDQLQDDVAPFGAVVGIADPDRGEAALQARQVLVHPERHARIHRHQLINTVAEDEAAVEHRNARLLDRHELSIQEDHDRPVTVTRVSVYPRRGRKTPPPPPARARSPGTRPAVCHRA